MIDIWHNPRCSKSRQALSLLKEAKVDFRERRYLEDVPSLEELKALHTALGQPPVVTMMRTGETMFRELGLSKSDSDDALLHAMAANPILIERPVVLSKTRAVIGRPPERVLDLL